MACVSDDETGFNKAIDVKHSETLGLQPVGILADELGGVLRPRNGDPTEVMIEFPSTLRKE